MDEAVDVAARVQDGQEGEDDLAESPQAAEEREHVVAVPWFPLLVGEERPRLALQPKLVGLGELALPLLLRTGAVLAAVLAPVQLMHLIGGVG